MSDSEINELTYHAMLVAWGEFAQSAGPGQTVESKFCMILFGPMEGWKTESVAEDYRLVAFGEALGEEFRVYDTGY